MLNEQKVVRFFPEFQLRREFFLQKEISDIKKAEEEIRFFLSNFVKELLMLNSFFMSREKSSNFVSELISGSNKYQVRISTDFGFKQSNLEDGFRYLRKEYTEKIKEFTMFVFYNEESCSAEYIRFHFVNGRLSFSVSSEIMHSDMESMLSEKYLEITSEFFMRYHKFNAMEILKVLNEEYRLIKLRTSELDQLFKKSYEAADEVVIGKFQNNSIILRIYNKVRYIDGNGITRYREESDTERIANLKQRAKSFKVNNDDNLYILVGLKACSEVLDENKEEFKVVNFENFYHSAKLFSKSTKQLLDYSIYS